MLLNKTLRSSTFRLALLYVGVFGVAVVALFAYVYWSTAGHLRSHDDALIIADQRRLIDVYNSGGRTALATLLGGGLLDESDIYLLADADYTIIASNLKSWPAEARGHDGWVEFTAPDWRPEAKTRPLLRAVTTTLPDGAHLLNGNEIDDMAEFAHAINTGLVIGVILLCILAAAAGISVTRRTVARIEAVNEASRAIMAGGLGRRIPLRGTRDEWDQLAQNLNTMLGRIEELVRGIKEVSDNVAHDLRTPLTRLRGRLEVALDHGMSVEAYQTLLGRTVADLDDVLKTFASLLRISAVEARERTVGFQPVDLAALAAEVADLFDPAAEQCGGQVRAAGAEQAWISGDRDLLFEALSNLIDNAIKHGAGDVAVHVEAVKAGTAGAAIVLTVADNGPGIPAKERGRVFERFYRLERSRSTPGNGLGLSLVAAVAQLHDAEVALDCGQQGSGHQGSVERGLKVTVTFRALDFGVADLPAPARPARASDPAAA